MRAARIGTQIPCNSTRPTARAVRSIARPRRFTPKTLRIVLQGCHFTFAISVRECGPLILPRDLVSPDSLQSEWSSERRVLSGAAEQAVAQEAPVGGSCPQWGHEPSLMRCERAYMLNLRAALPCTDAALCYHDNGPKAPSFRLASRRLATGAREPPKQFSL